MEQPPDSSQPDVQHFLQGHAGNIVSCFKQAGNTAGADPWAANLMQRSQLRLEPTVYSTSCRSVARVP